MPQRLRFVLPVIFFLVFVASCGGNAPLVDTPYDDTPLYAYTADEAPLCNEPLADETDDITQEYAYTLYTDSDGTADFCEETPEPLPPVVLRFGGDVTMSSVFGEFLRQNGVDYAFAHVRDLTYAADVSFFNLETAVGIGGASTKPSGFGFRSDPHTLQGLVNAGVDFVSVANNHTIDYGFGIFNQTMDYLNEYGIAFAGMGNNLAEADALTFIERGGLRIGFLAYTQIVPWGAWRATEDSPGINPLTTEGDFERAAQTVAAARELCDFLIVSVHFGTEYTHNVTTLQRRTAHLLIDAGADMIWGHHPHVLQPIEFYNDRLIFYSTGNFVFYKRDSDAGRTALFEVIIDQNGAVSARMYPVYIRFGQAVLLAEANAMYREILELADSISRPYGVRVDEYGNILWE
jgi:poly-gamma-glutamate synthesis protein (capsule biosynthesis protein)